MVSALKGLFNDHRLTLPMFEWSLGEGSDILTTLHCYVIGDPLNLFVVFFPERYLWIAYDVLILLRLYLAGLVFSKLCFEQGIRNKYGIIAGALTYVFCFWGLYAATRHFYFANPMIYFPMIIIGIERVLKGKRPWWLVLSVFLSALSNFYFFYMIVVLTVVYVLIRLTFLFRKNIREYALMLFKIGFFCFWGTSLASVILLPMFFATISVDRVGADYALSLFYPLRYYSGLPSQLLTGNNGAEYWVVLGFSSIVFPAVCLLFKRKEHSVIKALHIVAAIFICFPIFGKVLNGFSYVTNRWCWGISLLCAFTVSLMWTKLLTMSWEECRFVGICSTLYIIICFAFKYSRNEKTFESIAIVLVILLVLSNNHGDNEVRISRNRQFAVVLLTVFSILTQAFSLYSFQSENYISEFATVAEIDEIHNNDARVIRLLDEDNSQESNGIFRYSGDSAASITKNAGLYWDVSSTAFFWSISNPYVTEFREAMNIRESNSYSYLGYDDRAALLELAANKYYMTTSIHSPVPYGYSFLQSVDIGEERTEAAITNLSEEMGIDPSELTEDQINAISRYTSKRYVVYMNESPLPLTYSYDNAVSESFLESLNGVERQEVMLQAVVIDGPFVYTPVLTSASLDYQMQCDGTGVTVVGNSFIVTQKNATVKFVIDESDEGELYVLWNGFEFSGLSAYDLYFGTEINDPNGLYSMTRWHLLPENTRESVLQEHMFWTAPKAVSINIQAPNGITKLLQYYTPEKGAYSGRHDFIVNMGYYADGINTLTFTFPTTGIYTFTNLELIRQPYTNYDHQLELLRENTLQNVQITTDCLTGQISLDKDKWLCFAIPYSDGWTAYIDDQKTDLYRANIQYMAIHIDAGNHNIKLKYQTPMLSYGIKISLVGWTFFFIVVMYTKIRSKWFPSLRREN